MNQEDYEFIKQEMVKMFSELNHRMFVRSGEDFLLTPEVDKLANAANWMLKAWRKCFEFYATPNIACSGLEAGAAESGAGSTSPASSH